MSDHGYTSVSDLPAGGEKLDHPLITKVKGIGMLVGVVGFIISVAALMFPKTQQVMAYSYLWGFSLIFTLCLGGFFWALLHHAINAGWGVAVRRIWVQLANIGIWLLFLALPLVLIPGVREALWEWMVVHGKATKAVAEGAYENKEAYLKADENHQWLLYQKFEYLNMSFWMFRFAFYFAVIILGAWFLRKFSLKQEEDGYIKHTFHARRFACGMIPLFAVTLTFWAIDWLQCLDYTWFSTMWGVYIFAGCAWASMAFSILAVTWLRSLGYMEKVVTKEHYHLMGKLLFAFTVFWAYIAFSQFFLIWYADIAEETKFYHLRNTGGWWLLSLLLLFGHFGLPFLALLHAWVKKSPKILSGIAIWILVMHAADMYWIIMPERGVSISHGQELTTKGGFLFDLLALITMAGVLVWAFLHNLTRHSVYPWRDPRLQESISVSN